MGSFDKSYYDILNKYEGIVKEGMNVKPVYYKKTGNTYTPIQNNMELARINPNEIFVSSGDPNIPYVPYSVTTQQQNKTTQAPTAQQNQPSISVTGDANPNDPIIAPDSGPQGSVSVAGQRIQSPAFNTSANPAQKPTNVNVSPETQKAVADFTKQFAKNKANPTQVINQKKGPIPGSTNNFTSGQSNTTNKNKQPLQFSGVPKS